MLVRNLFSGGLVTHETYRLVSAQMLGQTPAVCLDAARDRACFYNMLMGSTSSMQVKPSPTPSTMKPQTPESGTLRSPHTHRRGPPPHTYISRCTPYTAIPTRTRAQISQTQHAILPVGQTGNDKARQEEKKKTFRSLQSCISATHTLCTARSNSP